MCLTTELFGHTRKGSLRLTPLALQSMMAASIRKMKVPTNMVGPSIASPCQYDSSPHHTVLVRLYRPGYQTLELQSWRAQKNWTYPRVKTPQEHEQAIDDLLTTWRTTPIGVQCQYSIRSGETPRN